LAARKKAANRYYSGPPSDHFDGTLFFNPDGQMPGRFTDLLKWQLSGDRSKWPAVNPSPFEPAEPAARIDGGDYLAPQIEQAGNVGVCEGDRRDRLPPQYLLDELDGDAE